MTIYRRPAETRAVLFDVDGTLYSNHDYGRHQTDELIGELARARGQSFGEAREAVARARSEYSAAHGGASTSLGNAMAALGIDMATSVAWRERLFRPGMFLSADPLLRAALLELRAAGLTLAIVTNNPRSVGLATLGALGVEDLFSVAVGLDDTMKSKPAPEPYLLAARMAGAAPIHCLSVGDRYDVDLAEPLELGMGAVLVTGVEDVYALPDALPKNSRD